MPAVNLIKATAISATYPGGTTVFTGTSLTVTAGHNLTILGPSGSGKSTLLKILAGVKQPAAGSLNYATLEGRKVRTGLMFQQPLLLPWLSVLDNVALGGKYEQRLHQATDPEELLSKVGLAGLGARRPHALSGGQRQRAALARTLAHRPEVLLLDEPFSALEYELRNSLRYLVFQMAQEHGITIVLVTHQPDEATVFGGSVIHMTNLNQPKQQQSLPPRQADEQLAA